MRSYRLEVYDQGTGRYFWKSDADVVWDYIEDKTKLKKKCKFTLVRSNCKEWKITTRSAEKYNVEQNLLRIGQAVPKAGSIF